MTKKFIVFTDMDGTLLDHYNYSFDAAVPMLKKLESLDIPVIANTSKTRVELEALRENIGNTHPFISENGAAVNIPLNYFPYSINDVSTTEKYLVKSFVEPRDHWRKIISEIEQDYGGAFLTFTEMGILDIMQATGLDKEAARMAMQREFGEPVKWIGDEDRLLNFIAALEQHGAHILKGGRFIHVSGKCDKGIALNWLTDIYTDSVRPKTIALGDSNNDIAMLEAADYSVIVKSPSHDTPVIKSKENIIITKECGPAGWAEALEKILTQENLY